MLALTREALVGHLVTLREVVDEYVRGDTAFVEQVLKWLADVQETLVKLRSPLASLVATARSTIAAVGDGANPGGMLEGRVSRRKAQRAAASMVLDKVDGALRAKVEELDSRLDVGRERIAQVLAVGHSHVNLKRPEGEVPRSWYSALWVQLGQVDAVHDAHVFVSASFGPSDRAYLLEDLLDRMDT